MRVRLLARWLLTIVVWLAVSFVVGPARAQSFGASASIEAGREREVLALFAPMTLGGDVTPGWRLMNVAVESRFIRVGVVGPGGARGTLVLDHPSRASGPRTSKSFVMQPDPADASTPAGAAIARLMDAVVENDPGGFFRMNLPPTKHEGGEIARRMRGPLLDWITDGVVLLTALCVLVGVLAWRELAGHPRWMTWALVGVLALSLLLRTTISVEAALDVWPFSRVLPIARLAFNGPVLAWASRRFGATFPLTDVVFTTNLVVAIVSPLAMFTHARPLLRDPRLALAAVAIFAVAPGHIRFSHSDTAFIPALALSSVTFGLVHRAVRDESRWFRAAALVVLPVLQLCTLATRPLNILFLPLYFVQLFVLDDSKAPIARRAVVAAITTVVGVGFFFSSFLVEHEGTIVQSVDLGLPLRVVGALFKPRLNTLLHPWVTPPVLTLLAVFGVVVLFRKQERRRAWFLMGWAFLFFAGHAVVLPSTVEMQSRYQLHLIVPVAMLASIGLFELFARRRRLGIAAVVVLAASPLLHLGFERDVAFNDMREFAFVRAARHEIPDGCTVLEALEGDHDARFTRMGLAIEAGSVHQRFRVQPLNVPRGETLREEARAVLANPPACLVYYEGLPCRFVKARDEPISRACAAAAASVPWSVVSEARFPSRPYDENLTKGFGPTERDLALRVLMHAPRAR